MQLKLQHTQLKLQVNLRHKKLLILTKSKTVLDNGSKLTHLFPMQPFSTSFFRGKKKDPLGTNGLNQLLMLSLKLPKIVPMTKTVSYKRNFQHNYLSHDTKVGQFDSWITIVCCFFIIEQQLLMNHSWPIVSVDRVLQITNLIIILVMLKVMIILSSILITIFTLIYISIIYISFIGQVI